MSKRILLRGLVQGVGCRAYCIRYARKNMLKGAVSNLRSGDVELLIAGENDITEGVNSLVSDLRNNPSGYPFYGRIDEFLVQDFSGRISGDYSF